MLTRSLRKGQRGRSRRLANKGRCTLRTGSGRGNIGSLHGESGFSGLRSMLTLSQEPSEAQLPIPSGTPPRPAYPLSSCHRCSRRSPPERSPKVLFGRFSTSRLRQLTRCLYRGCKDQRGDLNPHRRPSESRPLDTAQHAVGLHDGKAERQSDEIVEERNTLERCMEG